MHYSIQVRRFPVLLRDERTGEERQDAIILTKEHLRAAQLLGQSSTELIHSAYSKEGFKVLKIEAPEKREIRLNLQELWKLHGALKGEKTGEVHERKAI